MFGITQIGCDDVVASDYFSMIRGGTMTTSEFLDCFKFRHSSGLLAVPKDYINV